MEYDPTMHVVKINGTKKRRGTLTTLAKNRAKVSPRIKYMRFAVIIPANI